MRLSPFVGLDMKVKEKEGKALATEEEEKKRSERLAGMLSLGRLLQAAEESNKIFSDLISEISKRAAELLKREARCVFPAKVLADGRITIPVEWRELLNIKEGDIVKLEILDIVKPKRSSADSTQTAESKTSGENV